MKTISIRFVDFWEDQNHEDSFMFKLLSQRYDLIITKKPDYIFYSVYGYEHLLYDCIRIFYTPEQCFPDFDFCDYAIGFDNFIFEDRYVRVPYYAILYSPDELKKINYSRKYNEVNNDLGFCSFIYSNPKANRIRNEIFLSLNEYKKVKSGGKILNNIGDRVKDKIEFISKFKFDLAIENGSYPGYVTEKIIESYIAGVVPIYYGDPLITIDFNPDSFINLNDFDSISDGIKYIIKVDNDDKLYKSYRESVIFNKRVFTYHDQLFSFLGSIFNQNYREAFRRPNTYFSNYKKRDKMVNYYFYRIILRPIILLKRLIRR
jgi:hypothetical protein